MAKGNSHMYPGINQSDYPSMLDSRLYPQLLAPPPLPDQPSPKVCGVCGDRAKSLHFGGMACDSCKAFFRRSVQNEAYKHFRCSYDNRCVITISSRKCCQACRFNKCTEIGMEKGWVMSEEERVQQSKIRQEKKRQKLEEEERRRMAQEHRLVPHEPLPQDQRAYLSDGEMAEIDQLISTYYDMCQRCPVGQNCATSGSEGSLMVQMFLKSVSRVVSFVRELPRFKQLQELDQKILMTNAVLGMCILRGTMVYDSGSGTFSMKNSPDPNPTAKVSIDGMKSLLTPELYDNHRRYITKIREMCLDEKTILLLQMIVLYADDRKEVSDQATVLRNQEHYTDLLRRYMQWRYGEENTRLLYPRLVHSLADLRALTEAHTKTTLFLPRPDVDDVREKLGEIDLNPYPNFPEMTATQEHPAAPQRHRSEMGNRAGRPDRRGPQRSASLPVYSAGYGPPVAGPAAHQTAAYPHQRFPAGYPAEPCGSHHACSFARDASQQWPPGYHAVGMPSWSEDQRQQQRAQPGVRPFAGQQDYVDFCSLLDLEKDDKMKSDPGAAMPAPQNAHAQQTPVNLVNSAPPGFNPFCTPHYDEPRANPYADSYHGNYPPNMQ